MLRPTYVHPQAESWAEPGGPWDVPPLDLALSPTDPATEAKTSALAGALVAAGVGPGDTVAWQRPNVPGVLLLLRACWRIGAVAAPIHHLAGEADVARTLDALRPRLYIDRHDPFPSGGDAVGRDQTEVAPSDLAVALSTSGSTGAPKIVLHTHRGLVYKARVMAAAHELGRGDRILMPAPLAHISGLLNGVLVPGVCDMRVSLMARWDPAEALRLIQRDQISFMVGPPAFFVSLMDAPGFSTEQVASLRLVSSGGAGVTPGFVDRASRLLDCWVKRTYGSTEAPTITTSTPADPIERARETDGRATGQAEVRSVEGELWVRGPELFEGYADPEDTAAVFDEAGWYRTGDLGSVDEDGWVTVTGRLEDLIIRGGENIAAGEVEAVLEAHPDVRQAAVVGIPDERLGEQVGAFVVANGPFTLATCQAWFAEQGITKFKWPEHVKQVDELPLLPSGKPDRAALRNS